MVRFFLILLCVVAGAGLGALIISLVKMPSSTKKKLMSVTRMIFVMTLISALAWVFISYAIAIYSTIYLGQVYTMAELSQPAIQTILGVGILKVVENVFEHNEGKFFGKSDNDQAA